MCRKIITRRWAFYGTIKHRLFRDEIFIVMFPLYSETHKETMTRNYLCPIFSLRHGNELEAGNSGRLWVMNTKTLTTKTNGFGDVDIVGGYDKWFYLWPFGLKQLAGVGTDSRAELCDYPGLQHDSLAEAGCDDGRLAVFLAS